MYIFHNGIVFSSLVEKILTQLKQLSIAKYNYTNNYNTIEIIEKKNNIRIVAVKEAVCYSLINNKLKQLWRNKNSYFTHSTLHGFFQKLRLMITNNLYVLLLAELKK